MQLQHTSLSRILTTILSYGICAGVGQAFRIRAAIKLQLNDSVSALTDANYSIALDSNAAAGHLLKADALYRLRQYERARESAVTSLSIADTANNEGSTTTTLSAGEEVIPGAQNLLKRIDQKLGVVATGTELHTSGSGSAESAPQPSHQGATAPAEQHATRPERGADEGIHPESQYNDALLNGEILLPHQNQVAEDPGASGGATQHGPDLSKIAARAPNAVDLTASLVMGEPSRLELSQSLYESFRSNEDEEGDSSTDDDV